MKCLKRDLKVESKTLTINSCSEVLVMCGNQLEGALIHCIQSVESDRLQISVKNLSNVLLAADCEMFLLCYF